MDQWKGQHSTMPESNQRGIKYIIIDLDHMKLFVFVNGSFANNKDFSSQIRYLIILVTTGGHTLVTTLWSHARQEAG
jgi:hypothetical protein